MKNFNSNINLGNCASLVALQHILFEQTFFVPDRPRLSPEENIVLLKSAMSGKFIIIPGYTNTRDWFASLDEATTKDIVSNLSYEINIKNYSQLMKQYFSRIAIDIQNLQDLKHSLEMGMIVPVRFKVDGTREEHIFLITEIIERDSFFELGVYDSNLGGHLPAGSMKIKDVDRFKIDKRTGLFTQKDYTAGAQLFVDQQVFERRSGFIQAKLHPNMAKFALEAIDKQSFAFSLNELSVNGLQ